MKSLTKLFFTLAFTLTLGFTALCSAVEMKTYVNEDYNFQLDIPEVCDYYIPNIPPMPPSIMYAANNTGYNIDVKVFPSGDKVEGDDNGLRGLGFIFRDQLRKSGYAVLSEKLVILDNGKHAWLTSYTRPASYGGGMNIFGTTVQLWTAGRIYILNYSLTNLDYEKYGDSIRNSYQSFATLE